ncbi:MAG: PTS sugar transporter subunit IIA, partial [Deltaproteobacteria bacterium]|nr:PTS sugar transporter subunit IIA [Deltaproteobacteria bacterium]
KLTINEIAKSFDLPKATMERWIRQGRIPIQQNGKEGIFRQSVLNKWAAAHNLHFELSKASPIKSENLIQENLVQAMKCGGVFHRLKGDTVEGVLKSAVNNMPDFSTDTKEEVYSKLLEREKLTSTGIGRGIAIPHLRTPLKDVVIRPAITTCFFENPIDFNAVDDKPVFAMFVLLSPSIKIHLHLLSRLSFCVRSDKFIDFLKTSPASKALLEKISDCEKQLEKREKL